MESRVEIVAVGGIAGAALIALVGCGGSAAPPSTAQWPAIMTQLQPGPSFSRVAAPLPPEIEIVPPGPDIPAERARFSGKWAGWACWQLERRMCDVRLAVQWIAGDQAYVVYAFGSEETEPAYVGRLRGTFIGHELVLKPGRTIHFRFRPDGNLEYINFPANSVGDDGLLGVLMREPESTTRTIAAIDWNSIMKRVAVGHPKTAVQAALPRDLEISRPERDVPPERVKFLGKWAGSACWRDGAARCDTRLAVTQISGDTATVVHTWGADDVHPPFIGRLRADFVGGYLRVVFPNSNIGYYRLQSDGTLGLVIFPGPNVRATRLWVGALRRDERSD